MMNYKTEYDEIMEVIEQEAGEHAEKFRQRNAERALKAERDAEASRALCVEREKAEKAEKSRTAVPNGYWFRGAFFVTHFKDEVEQ